MPGQPQPPRRPPASELVSRSFLLEFCSGCACCGPELLEDHLHDDLDHHDTGITAATKTTIEHVDTHRTVAAARILPQSALGNVAQPKKMQRTVAAARFIQVDQGIRTWKEREPRTPLRLSSSRRTAAYTCARAEAVLPSCLRNKPNCGAKYCKNQAESFKQCMNPSEISQNTGMTHTRSRTQPQHKYGTKNTVLQQISKICQTLETIPGNSWKLRVDRPKSCGLVETHGTA